MKNLFLVATLACVVAVALSFNASVQDRDGNYCIVFDGNVTGTIKYENTSNETASFDFSVDPSTLNISGECLHVDLNKTVETLQVSFLPNHDPEANQWELVVVFTNDKDSAFKIDHVDLTAKFWPELNASSKLPVKYSLVDAGDNWSVTGTNGYSCSSSKFQDANGTFAEFHDVRALAFATLKNPVFPKDQVFELCALDTKTSELVPIIVGALLAGLVIIVLVAYLIGRARAKRQGYASV